MSNWKIKTNKKATKQLFQLVSKHKQLYIKLRIQLSMGIWTCALFMRYLPRESSHTVPVPPALPMSLLLDLYKCQKAAPEQPGEGLEPHSVCLFPFIEVCHCHPAAPGWCQLGCTPCPKAMVLTACPARTPCPQPHPCFSSTSMAASMVTLRVVFHLLGNPAGRHAATQEKLFSFIERRPMTHFCSVCARWSCVPFPAAPHWPPLCFWARQEIVSRVGGSRIHSTLRAAAWPRAGSLSWPLVSQFWQHSQVLRGGEKCMFGLTEFQNAGFYGMEYKSGKHCFCCSLFL